MPAFVSFACCVATATNLVAAWPAKGLLEGSLHLQGFLQGMQLLFLGHALVGAVLLQDADDGDRSMPCYFAEGTLSSGNCPASYMLGGARWHATGVAVAVGAGNKLRVTPALVCTCFHGAHLHQLGLPTHWHPPTVPCSLPLGVLGGGAPAWAAHHKRQHKTAA
jgi:hypothetical protein